MVTPLGKAIEFFREFGLFDVVLPFLLTFTIVFAILEKTKLLGVVKQGDNELPNKNLNSMVAFVIGLLVVATANVVGFINEALPNIIIVVVIVFSYLIMLGLFLKTGEFKFAEEHKGWYRAFMIVIFIAVLAISANAIKVNEAGNTALEAILDFLINNWSGAVVTSIIFLTVIIFILIYVTKTPGKSKEGESSMATINDVFYQLQASGVFEFILPFLLIFTIVFAILEKTKLLGIDKDGEPRKNINVIVALVLALIVINQFEIIDRLDLFVPKVALFIIVAIMFLVLVGIFGVNVHEGFSGTMLFIFALLSLFVIYWALVPSSSSDFFTGSDLGYWIQDNIGTMIALVVIGIIIWAVVGGKKGGSKQDSFENWVNRSFGRVKGGRE